MILATEDGKSFDTEKDLTAPERHILQKLFLWETMAATLDEFVQQKNKALLKGWNNSGPVKQSEALQCIIVELQKRVCRRVSR